MPSMLSARAIAAEVSANRLDADEALRQGEEACGALEADLQIYMSKGEQRTAGQGPLAGVGIGVKDIFDTHDLPTGQGSPIYQGHQPAADAALVSMLRNAGATVTGKTVTTEFAWFTPGATRNPNNIEHTPGGSSSGSAAGVAAGYFAAAIGSQTGGSVVRPAAFCGVSGYKPSFRLFPTVGMKHFSWSLDTPGFFAASAADVAFVAAACSGRDLNVDLGDVAPPRIGLYVSSIDDLMDDDMTGALVAAGKMAREAGAEFTTVEEPQSMKDARQAHGIIQHFEAKLSLADEFTRSKNQLSPPLRDYLNEAGSVTPDQYDDARRTSNHARKASKALFENCDILLAPSARGAAPHGLEFTGDPIFNKLWTLMGMPAVNVAGMHGANGLPVGLQVLAPFGQDQRALQAAHWLEKCIQAGS